MWCWPRRPTLVEDGSDQFEQLCEALIAEGVARDCNEHKARYFLIEMIKVERDTQVKDSEIMKQRVVDELSRQKAEYYREIQHTDDMGAYEQLQKQTRHCEYMITLLKQPLEDLEKLINEPKQPARKKMAQ